MCTNALTKTRSAFEKRISTWVDSFVATKNEQLFETRDLFVISQISNTFDYVRLEKVNVSTMTKTVPGGRNDPLYKVLAFHTTPVVICNLTSNASYRLP